MDGVEVVIHATEEFKVAGYVIIGFWVGRFSVWNLCVRDYGNLYGFLIFLWAILCVQFFVELLLEFC